MFKLRGFDQSSGQQKYGWNSKSHDYNNHLTQMMRTASVLSDVPQYPGVHNIFKKKAVESNEPLSPPEAAKKKVHIAEQEKTIICSNNGNSGTAEESSDESIDIDADSFIQQKHRGFELCKWTTFKKAR